MGQTKSEQLFQSHLHTVQKVRLLIFGTFGVMLVALIFSSCANRGVITGGEKDTIPPELLTTVPFNGSLDFKGRDIILTFDERVQAPQLKRQLLITPFTDVQYKVKVNKFYVQLTFDEPFSDSTTYTLNFADAITDVTESNPAQNASIAFSTWHIIDSLSMYGKIIDHMSAQPIEGAAVSVYQALDTLDIFTGKPYYFAFTDEFGRFAINNMKAGNYRVYAFADENRNYTNEPSSEAHGFISDTLLLGPESDSLYIGLILQDVQDLKFVNKRSIGNRYDVRYNKWIDSYNIEPIDSTQVIVPSHLTSENLVVRFYDQSDNLQDSIGYYLTVSDSVGNSIRDTIYVSFSEKELKPEELLPTIYPSNNSAINAEMQLTLQFPKPMASFNPDSFLIKYDTLQTIHLDSIGTWAWNWNQTDFSANVSLDENYLAEELFRIKTHIDSLISLDTLRGISLDSARVLHSLKRNIDPLSVQIYIGSGSFISVEGDSTELIKLNYQFKQPEKFGKISGAIEIDSTHFIVQLIDKDFRSIQEVENQRNYLFEYVPAGSYNIRVLVDSNGDGIWSFGNVRKGLEPEPVYIHPTFIELRENWEINNINMTISPGG